MTFTNEQANKIIESLTRENILLKKGNAHVKDLLEKEKSLREEAEEKYASLCEDCIRFYVSERDITTDTIFVQVNAPRFMSEEDFQTGVAQSIIKLCNEERIKTIFNKENISPYKEK